MNIKPRPEPSDPTERETANLNSHRASTASGHHNEQSRNRFKSGSVNPLLPHYSIEQVRGNLQRLTQGRSVVEEEEIRRASPVLIPSAPSDQIITLFENAFTDDELVNVVGSRHVFDRGRPGYIPASKGYTRSCEEWIVFCKAPQNQASEILNFPGGTWFRLNTVVQKGSGKNGWYTDRDITSFRYGLLECDALEINEQLALFAHLRLPIFSMTTSGGRSVHAIIKIDCTSCAEYKKTMKQTLQRLHAFGVDTINSNPSRFTRLAGVYREKNGKEDKRQRLLYLNPNPQPQAIFPAK